MANKEAGTEEYEFEVPDFDEDAFIHKELVSFKTTAFLFLWGIGAALVSWGIFALVDGTKTAWYLGILVWAVFAYLLRYIYPALKVDISHFGRREWFGTSFLLFFAWLAFFILLINPPITDNAEPTVDFFVSPSVQQTGGDVVFDLFVADNHRVDTYTFSLTKGTSTILDSSDLVRVAAGHYQATLADPAPGLYIYVASASDPRGQSMDVSGEFRVRSDAVQLILPQDSLLDAPTDTILVTVADLEPCESSKATRANGVEGDCLRTVYLDLADGTDLHMEHDAALGGWKATSNFAGWQQGTNTFSVVAEQANRFQGANLMPGGTLTLDGPFNVTVATTIGDYHPDVLPQDPVGSHSRRQTPGFELPLLAAALVAGIAIARRRQE